MWELDLLCARYGWMPSQRMGLREAGFSDGTAYDFDRSVAMFGRLIDARLHETVDRLVTAPKRPPNGMTYQRFPRYRLHELLVDDEVVGSLGDEEDGAVLPELAMLPTAGL